MNDEIKKWLIDNLSIELDTESTWHGWDEEQLVVILKIEDNEISKSKIPVRWLKMNE